MLQFKYNSPLAVFLLLVIMSASAVFLAFQPHWAKVFDVWFGNGSYTHAPLIIMVAVYVFWRSQWHTVIGGWEINWKYFIPLFVAILAWWIGAVGSTERIQWISLPVLLYCIFSIVYGDRFARWGWFPFLLLYFVLPIWSLLTPLLQDLTVQVATLVVRLLELPVIVEGEYFTIPAGIIRVEEGCSGIQYFMVGMSLSLLMAAISKGARNRVVVILSGLLLSILANWVRVSILILVAYYSEMRHPWVRDHEVFGWFVYFVTLSPLYFYVYRHGGSDRNEVACSQPLNAQSSLLSLVSAYLLLSLLLFSLPYLPGVIAGEADEKLPAWNVRQSYGAWEKNDWQLAEWQPSFNDAALRYGVAYQNRDTGHGIFIFAAYYGAPRNGSEFINYANYVLDKRWRQLSLSEFQVLENSQLDGKRVVARATSGKRWVIQYGYLVGGRFVNEQWLAKGLTIFNRITKGSDDAWLISVAQICGSECEDSYADLGYLFAALLQDIRQAETK